MEEKNFKIKTKLTKKYLNQMLALDNENFIEEDKGIFNVCLSWYKKNPNIYIMLFDKRKLIGYINFVPLKEETYEKFRLGKIHDMDLTSDDIEIYLPNKDYSCLFMSIVIHENYRNGFSLRFLTKAYENYLISLKKKKINIKRILSDCVNESLVKHLSKSRLGFNKIMETARGTTLFEKIF